MSFLGQRLRDLRGRLSLVDIAKEVGLSDVQILNYEKGARTPKQDTLKKLAECFEVPYGIAPPVLQGLFCPTPGRSGCGATITATTIPLSPHKREQRESTKGKPGTPNQLSAKISGKEALNSACPEVLQYSPPWRTRKPQVSVRFLAARQAFHLRTLEAGFAGTAI